MFASNHAARTLRSESIRPPAHSLPTPLVPLLVVISILVSPGSAMGQSTSGEISGIVTDSQAQPLPGATVRAMAKERGFSRRATVDGLGRFRLLQLPPGNYTVEAELPGFRTARFAEVRLRLQQTLRLVIELELELTHTIVVETERSMLDVSETTRMGLVETETLETLPFTGRIYTDLALLFPGVFSAAPGTFLAERPAVLTFSGQGARSNSFLVDGLDNNDDSFGARSNSSLSQEVIQEFRVLRNNFDAEFGRAAGGVLNVITRSGSNKLEVKSFAQVMPEDTGAWNRYYRQLADGEEESLRSLSRRQAGIFVSGPIVRNQAFFLVNYEETHETSPVGFQGAEFRRDPEPGGIF